MLFNIVLLTLLSMSGVLGSWGRSVSYFPERICALKGSSIVMRCTYSYPQYHTVQETSWFIYHWYRQGWHVYLSQDPEYTDRVEYLGDKKNNCTFRINQLRESDSKTYYFRFLTDKVYSAYTGEPGVTLEVTDLRVEVSPRTVTEGQYVTLTCRTTCSLTGSPAFIWYRNGSRLSFTNQRHQFTSSSEDGGQYSCAVKGHESPAVTLNVRYRPKNTFISVSPSGEIEEGSSVTLTCNSDANPPVYGYTWYKDNREVNWRRTHTIKKIKSSDAGEYSCRAMNDISSVRSPHIHLKVLCLKVEIKPDSVSEREMVTLSCTTSCTVSGLKRTFVWYKNSQIIPHGNHYSHYYFTARSEDAGNYSCAMREYQHLSSNVVLLRVNYPPKSISVSVSPSGEIVEGSSVTLTCRSDANPPVQRYTWFKKNGAVSSEKGGSEENYTIKNITQQDAGEYYCEAGNGIGKASASPPRLLDVQYHPKNTSVLVSASGEIVEGSSVSLACSSDANPPVLRYTWFKKNETGVWKEGSGKSLNFSDITSGNSGQYYCEAQNQRGAQNSTAVTIDVHYSPKNISLSVSPSGEIVEGSSVTLTCSSDANPPVQRYTWFKNKRAVSSGSSLNITNILSQDSGQYYCEAQNLHGARNSSAVTIDVQYSSKNTSVSVSPSGEIVEGSTVTLTCSSDANPLVQNYTWFKKNETGLWQAGSGQSLNFSNFRSWNSGQYYCEVQNKHGAENSTALLVTVQGGPSLIAAAVVGITVTVALVFLGVLWVRRRISTNETIHTDEDWDGNKSAIYGNVSGMAMSHTETQGPDTGNGEIPLYSSVQPASTRHQEELLYATVQKPHPLCEDDLQYASIKFVPSGVVPRSNAHEAEDLSIIYSAVSKCNA